MQLMSGDITRMAVDAIINAANTSLLGGGGVDGAIHRAGGPAILEACIQIRNRQGGCAVGEAVITPAGNMPARYVIHTVGPVWSRTSAAKADALLANAYHNSLKLAIENSIKTIAFPNISTGIYSFPKDKAAEIATRTVDSFLSGNEQIEKVFFVCFDEENYALYKQILSS